MTNEQAGRKSKVFIVDDHPIVRQGLAKLIDEQPDLVVCGEADSLSDALRGMAEHRPDLVLVDITLRQGDGIELCKQIRERDDAPMVLVVSMHDEGLYAERCLRAGAMGYVMKQDPPESVLVGLRKLLQGQIHLSEAMSRKVLENLAGDPSGEGTAPLQRLSDRELEVFRLIGKGHGVRAIAEMLFLSHKTVEAHKEHIKQKLNLKSSNALLQYAIVNGAIH